MDNNVLNVILAWQEHNYLYLKDSIWNILRKMKIINHSTWNLAKLPDGREYRKQLLYKNKI